MTFEDLKLRYDALMAAKLSHSTVDAWLAQWAEMTEDWREHAARLFVKTAVDTRNKADQEALQAWQTEVAPKIDVAEQALVVKLLDSGCKPRGHAMYMRGIQNWREIYREENVKLDAEHAVKDSEQTRIAGAQSVVFEGQERTLRQLAPFMEEKDRGLRERAWRAMVGRRMQDVPALDKLLDELLPIRAKKAVNAGFPSYTELRFREFGRFDYGVKDALALHENLLEAFSPLVARQDRWQAARLGLEKMRPWDTAVDTTGDAPLRPFKTGEELYLGCKRIFDKLDPEAGSMLEDLWKRGWLDLESRLGKGPGGFNYGFPKSKGSFIFWNAAGMQMDVTVLLHEGGHAFQGMLSDRLPSFFEREMPIEFAELGSMSMELMGMAHFGEFYSDPRDAERARLQYLLGIADGLCRIVAVDALQHRIHANPSMGHAERHAAFAELDAKSGSQVDYSGLEDIRASSWQVTLHVFRFPFYYVEYAFAQLGALQIWEASLKDPKAAFAKYKSGLALGGTKSLPGLYAAAGAELLPSKARLASLAATLESEINASLRRLGQPPLSA